MLPWVCTVMNDSWRQNVARTSEPYSAVMIFCFCFFFLTLSVIYYWTDAPQHDIYLIIISHSFSALLNNELYFLRYQKHINAMQPMSGQLHDWKYPNTRNRRPLVV